MPLVTIGSSYRDNEPSVPRSPWRGGSGDSRFSRLEQYFSSYQRFTRYTLQGRTSVCITESYDLRKGRQRTGTSFAFLSTQI